MVTKKRASAKYSVDAGKRKRKPNTTPHEDREQEWFLEWCAHQQNRYPVLARFYAVPNGELRHVKIAEKLKRQGVKPGVPDLVLPFASKAFHGFYLEMKRQKGGSVSESQEDWHNYLHQAEYHVMVCRGWREAAAETLWYLEAPQVEIDRLNMAR